ncbi:DUF418 domain-containing protein [Nocardia pseudobrasiliensis]|uniref:DUF418 domain-containing protein n=1 Tax=Nocardia pseudobrasiliensis TaxID=45979 RepID=A0A370IAH1_9NOCA|nr:DUF418 domain-containing protein [Nocardia pseudobrasiliensis]RDI67121.1 uncharacterized protein DFR76_103192 [Nocardia pseudobrasiliensis]
MADSPARVADANAAVPQTGSRPSRLPALDVLRGIAILGTLGTNVWILTHPAGFVGYLRDLDPPDGWWLWAERILQQLAQGKFLGLLTVMFGIGLAIQQRSAVRAGRAWPGGYPWRAALLLLDGLLNFLFVAEFDVLMGYAVTGAVVAFLLATSERARRRWLIGAAAVHVSMLTLIALAIALAPQSDTPADPTFDPNPYADGSFWDLVVFRVHHAGLFRLETIFVFPMSVALFLLGAWLFHAGVFEVHGARLRRRLMLLGFGVAAPLDLALGLWRHNLVLITRYGTAPLVGLAILALVARFYVTRERTGPVGRRFAEVGRMALSCYILQNLVASALCYGWGLGLAARISADARIPFTIAVHLLVSAIMMIFAHLWLRRFERGPVEWLWHNSYRALTRDRD